MPEKTIIVEYHGKRFPRVVSLRSGGKINFHADRTSLELSEYDALLLLKSNIRMTPERFEFSIAGVISEEVEQFEKEEEVEVEEKEETEESQEEVKPLRIAKGKNRGKK